MANKVIELFPSPSADFSQPIEMLEACHQRILRNCALLRKLAEHLVINGSDREAHLAARRILNYFVDAAPNHHLDEESDLFPALIAAVSSEEKATLESTIARLKSEHVSLDAMWHRVQSKLEEVEAGQASSLTEASAHNLGAAYEQHIRFEESELLPLARRLLSSGALAQIGASMAVRRGVKPPEH
jgi:hemerythrin-like domain-containing protein